jgi:hypothetical protein
MKNERAPPDKDQDLPRSWLIVLNERIPGKDLCYRY